MLTTLQKLGQLKHHTRTAYKLRHEMNLIKSTMDTQRRSIEQIKTVMTIQREFIDTFETSQLNQIPDTQLSSPPMNLIQTYADVLRRQEEWKDGELQIHLHDKEYAYKFYQLRQLHNVILKLIEETREDAKTYQIPFDYTFCFQAVQDTS